MRILQVAPPWFTVPPERYGGTELVAAALTDGLVAAGHEVTLVASGGSRTAAQLHSVYDTPPSTELGNVLVELPHVLAARRDAPGFDLVHDHTALGAAIGALGDGPPVVHTVHNAWTPPRCRLYREIAKDVHLVAISRDHASRAPTDVPLAGTVHNGIDLDRYPFGDTAGAHLAWLGRAGPDKGADVAVEVARRTGLPLRMGIKVNEPDERRWWHDVLLPELEGHHVDVTLNATHHQKITLLRDALALVTPLSWDEPFGLMMVEANACGTPVVVFARGAAPELVADGETGVLVEPDDVAAMARAVEQAAGLDRRACRHHVEQHFSAGRMLAGYLQVYDQVLRR